MKILVKAVALGSVAALYLCFGLEPTAWLFYEASHLLGSESIYHGYSLFRAAAHFFGLYTYQYTVCLLAGSLVALFTFWRLRRHET